MATTDTTTAVNSFTNTPQANADFYSSTTLTEDILGIHTIDVMSNDLGGKAKTLYSLDDGDASLTDLLEKDLARAESTSTDTSANGAKIWITADGKVGYDAATLDASFKTALQGLGAGEYLTDTFTYAIRLGNGTLAWNTVTVRYSGVNDAPTVISFQNGGVTEDSATPDLSTTGTVTFDDIDLTDGHTVSNGVADAGNTLGGTLTATITDTATGAGDGTVTWSYSVANSATQYLGAGDTATETFTVTITDDEGATVSQVITITVTGTNDLATITGASTGTVTEDGDGVTTFQTVSGTLVVSDADAGEAELQPIAAGTAGDNGYGTFEVGADGVWTYTLDNTDPAVQALAVGEPLTDTITVYSEDNSASQVITVTIVGTNDAPVAVAVADDANEDGPSVTVSADYDDVDASDTHTFTVNTTGTLGSVTNNLDGTFTYDPNDAFESLAVGETTTDTFTYTVDDGNGGTDTETVTITITGQNDAPVAVAVADDANEDGPAVVVSADYDDVDASDTHTFTVNTIGTLGSVTNNLDGTFTYDPNGAFESLAVGETTTDTFTYTVDDGNGGTDTETVTITITGQNDAPVAVAVADDANEDGPSVTVSADYDDVDASDTHTFTVNTTGTLGSVTNNLDGTFTYDPNGAFESLAVGESTTDSFTYTVDDGNGGADTETVTITITGQNDAPVAVAVAGDANEDGPSVTVAADYDDVDASDTHTFTVNTTGTLGSVTNNLDGTFTYDPNGAFESLADGESTTDTFSYTVDDGNGGTDTETVTITITGQNDAPVAVAVADDADEDGPSVTVAADYDDVDASDTHTFTVNTTGTLGSVTNNLDGTFTYDPDGAFESLADGESTTDTFTYTVDDGNGGTDTETVTITITGQNDAPVAVAVADDVNEDGPSVTVAADFDDVDTSDTHAFTVNTTGTLGSVTNNLDGTFTYDPDGAFESLADGEITTDTFTYTVDDGNGGTDTETVTITITGQNDAPVAVAVADDANEDGPSVTVAADYDDVDASDTHIFTVNTTGTLGSVTNNLDGTFTYDPNGAFESLADGESTTDTFSYTVDDGNGGTDTETVTITITGQNDAPVAVAVADSANEDGPSVTVSADYDDVDASDTHTFTVNTTGTLGSVTNNLDGTFTYDPNDAFESLAVGESATDTFTYTVDDGNGGTDTETVTITIHGQNDAPVAVAVADDADEDGPSVTVSANFDDVDASDTHTFTVNTTGTLGSVTNNFDGTFTYDPNDAFESLAVGESATDTFTYTVDDGNGGTDTETVTITIAGQNDAPVAVAVADDANEDGPSVTVSADYDDVDTSDTHIFTVNTTGTLGSVANNLDGTFTYDPNGAFESLADGDTATDTFTYTVDDGNGGTDTETVTITVHGENDAPEAGADVLAASEDTPLVFPASDLLVNDDDVDNGTTLTVSAVSNPVNGTVSLAAGQITFTPAANFSGGASFDYTISDGDGGTDTVTVTVNVAAVNDAPVITSDGGLASAGVSVAENTAAVTTVTATDVDSATLTYSIAGGVDAAKFSINSTTGALSFVSAPNFESPTDDGANNVYDVIVQVSDGAAVDTQAIAVTVTDVVEAAPPTSPPVFTGTGDPNDFDSLGLAGSQTITGAGNVDDTFYGGAGNDTLNGGNGADKLYGGSGDDIIDGQNHVDTLYGGSGNDTILGDNSDDTIIGGYGADALNGGNSADTFVYLSTLDTGDTITGFTVAADKIDLSAIDANTADGDNDAFSFVAADTNALVANSVTWHYDGVNTHVWVENDGNTATAEMEIILTGAPPITATDFIL